MRRSLGWMVCLMALPWVPLVARSECLVVGSEDKIVQVPRTSDNRFGYEVAIDGDTALIADGARPAVEVHVRSAGTWSFQALLNPGVPDIGDWCGAVAIDGDLAVVGSCFSTASGTDAGAAYVFERTGTTWTQRAVLVADDAASGDRFGQDAGISGGTIVVGAPLQDAGAADAGAAYVFARDAGGTWRQAAKLGPPSPGPVLRFGTSVAIDRETIVVGRSPEPWDVASFTGDAFVFELRGGAWVRTAALMGPDTAPRDRFGLSVDVDGDLIVVGARDHDHVATDAGAGYVFRRALGGWDFEAELLAADGRQYDALGLSVGISGNLVIATALGDDDIVTGGGSAYAWSGASGSWAELAEVHPSDAQANQWYGYDGDVSGGTLLAGAIFDGGFQLPGYGAAYATCLDAPPPPEADCANGSDDDGDGAIDCDDIDCRMNLACRCAPLACGVVVADPPAPCSGDRVTLTLELTSPGVPPVDVTWDVDGDSIPDAAGNPVTVVIGSGFNIVLATARDACPSPGVQECTGGAFLPVPDPPAPAITPSGSTSFCATNGESVTLDAGAGYAGYQWIRDGADLAGETTATLIATTSGSYAVRVTDANGCTATSAPVIVDADACAPTCDPLACSGITATPDPGCQGSSVTLTASVSGGVAPTTVSWDFDGDGAPDASGNPAAVTLPAGARDVVATITDSCALGAQSTSCRATVTVNAAPAPGITASGPTSFCATLGESVTLDAGAGFASYQWTRDGADLPGETAPTLPVSTSGAYAVRVTDAARCVGTSADVRVNADACGQPPGEVSDVRGGEPPLLLRKAPGVVTFELEPDAVAYNFYEGPIGSWRVPLPVSAAACHVTTWTDNGDGTVTVSHEVAAGSWLLVTASNRAGEGTPGRESPGGDRHARGAWTDCGPTR